MPGGVIIATTRLISMHQNKGKSLADCIADRIDYALNPAKTNNGKYVSSYECDPKTVKGEFLLFKKIYSNITGREQTNDVILYQIRQSFKPGEITPELANEIGYERWAEIFNLKQMAQTIKFLTENNLIAYEDIEKKAQTVTDNFNQLSAQIKTAEKRMREVGNMECQTRIDSWINNRNRRVDKYKFTISYLCSKTEFGNKYVT